MRNIEPPEGLLETIMVRISGERRRLARIRFVFSTALSVVALLAIIPALRELNSEIVRSGFGQFLSLIFSDAGVLAAYWQDFTMTILESFPALGMSAVLAAAFAFIASARIAAKNKKTAFA